MADRHPKQRVTFAVLARWILLLAAVHRLPGWAIGVTIAGGLVAEQVRKRWTPRPGEVA